LLPTPPPTLTSTLSLHDALPIFCAIAGVTSARGMTLVFRIIDVMSSRGRTTLAVDCSEECSEAFEVEIAAPVTMRRATVRHDSFIGSSGPPTEEPTVERRSVRLSRARGSSFARSTPPSEHREMRGICDLKQC